MTSKTFDCKDIISACNKYIDECKKKREFNLEVYINQYSTGRFKYPTVQEMGELNILTENWKLGDRLYKYADKHYGDPSMWWIIAWFNKKPTENDFEIGQQVLVPYPLERIFKYFGE